MSPTESVVVGIVSLMLVASLCAVLLPRLGIAYTVGLVPVGLALGYGAVHWEALEHLRLLVLTHDVVFFVLIPTLIFEAALHLEVSELRKHLSPVLLLAVLGVVLTTAIIGLVLSWVSLITVGVALVFGAAVSATDPVAVIALFRELGVGGRLAVIMDGESLFNDATGVVLFGVLLAFVATGSLFSAETVTGAALAFFRVFLGGIAVGVAFGYLMIGGLMLNRSDTDMIAALYTAVAYLVYIAAESWLGVSGIMAVLFAGLTVTFVGGRKLHPKVRIEIKRIWGYLAFVANSMVFLLLGLSEAVLVSTDPHILAQWPLFLAAIAAMLLARAVTVYGLVGGYNLVASEIRQVPLWEQHVLFWGSLRGAIPLALALGLPPDFPNRSLLVSMIFAVVVFTLVVQGTSIGALIRRLRPSDLPSGALAADRGPGLGPD